MAEKHSGFQATGDIDMNSKELQNLVDPTNAQDAATKSYVDSVVAPTHNEEYKSGSDCSGSDGASERVLTLANTSLSSHERVYLDGIRLKTDDYDASHKTSSSTITFKLKVWNNQKIIVDYLT